MTQIVRNKFINIGKSFDAYFSLLVSLLIFFQISIKCLCIIRKGIRIGHRIFLEYGDKFDWPDLNAEDGGEQVFCYGLRDQIGVLCDGTVVPCCLDHDGDLALGNLFIDSMEQILETDRAKAIFSGFSHGVAAEELCRKCGYARRFG